MTANLPDRLQRSLAQLGTGESCALLVRHADRPQFPPGSDGNEVELNDLGRSRSLALGGWLRSRPQVTAKVSPVLRCWQTAQLALAGHTDLGDIEHSHLLGEPGPFVVDRARCSELFATMRTPAVVRALIDTGGLEGMRTVTEATRLVRELLDDCLQQGGCHLLVSHDAILMPLIFGLCGERFVGDWLPPLDGAVFTRRAGRTQVWWGGVAQEVMP